MSHRIPRASAAFAVFALVGVAGAGRTEAFTLQQLAAMIDAGRITAAVQVASPSDALLLEPMNTQLTSQATEFQITVADETLVRVEVTNEAGECVCSARMVLPAGVQKVGFSGRDASGRMLPNGSYHYTVVAGGAMQSAFVSIAR